MGRASGRLHRGTAQRPQRAGWRQVHAESSDSVPLVHSTVFFDERGTAKIGLIKICVSEIGTPEIEAA